MFRAHTDPLGSVLVVVTIVVAVLISAACSYPNVITTVGPMHSANTSSPKSISPFCVLQIIRRSVALIGV